MAEQEDEKQKEQERIETWINPLVDIQNVQLTEIEAYHQSSMKRKVLSGKMQLYSEDIEAGAKGLKHQASLLLTEDDISQNQNKAANVRFRRGTSEKQRDSDEDVDVLEADVSSMAVSELEITNSTHITRVKDKQLRKYYRSAYPFINFDRPNCRGIIYAAASKTPSKNVCVITSGPKGMIRDCIRWGAEIGVDVHYEVFDW